MVHTIRIKKKAAMLFAALFVIIFAALILAYDPNLPSDRVIRIPRELIIEPAAFPPPGGPYSCHDRMSQPINMCNLAFSTGINYVVLNPPSHLLPIMISNPLNATRIIQVRDILCRCDEHLGDPFDACGEYIPFTNFTHNVPYGDCFRSPIYNITLLPFETKIISVNVSLYAGQFCGSTQLDLSLVSVDGNTRCVNARTEGFVAGGFVDFCNDCPNNITECGNGIVNPGEQCDLGIHNGQPGYNCTLECKLCIDKDNDSICDENDKCKNTTNIDYGVNEDGCNPFELCKPLNCGTLCMNTTYIPLNSTIPENSTFSPDDKIVCTTAIKEREGIPYPACTPMLIECNED